MKNFYVSGLSDGARVDDVFLIYGKSLGYKQDGSPFVRLKLGDCTGTIDAIKWDISEANYNSIANDDFVRIRGVVTSYNDKLQIKLDSLRKHTEKVEPTDFLPQCDQDVDEMLAELAKIVSSVKHPSLKALLDYFLSDPEFVARFSTAPAAQRIHHAYIGGLLEHTLSVAQMCDLAASHYAGVDRDLLLTGAILHDIGKIEEFSWEKSIKYSDSGHFVGHIVAGTIMVEKAVDAIGGFDPLLKLVIKHMVVTHHGQKDWGSPKRPKSIESFILHQLEDLDAKINTFRTAVKDAETKDDADLWTERHWVFERPLFRGIPRYSDPAGENGDHPLNQPEPDFDPFAEE